MKNAHSYSVSVFDILFSAVYVMLQAILLGLLCISEIPCVASHFKKASPPKNLDSSTSNSSFTDLCVEHETTTLLFDKH